jgi:hypothetical protein
MYTCYVEVLEAQFGFCLGATSSVEILNDIDGELVNFQGLEKQYQSINPKVI